MNYHELLLKQLDRLNINLFAEPQDSIWLQLMGLISAAYSEHDDYRATMEHSLDGGSDEIKRLNVKYKDELDKLSTFSYDAVIVTDVDWKILSVNRCGELILKTTESCLVGSRLNDKLIFLNSQTQSLDCDKLKNHFECGNNYSCNKGVVICKDVPGQEVHCAFTIAPFYQGDMLSSYIVVFRDISQEVQKQLDYHIAQVQNECLFANRTDLFFNCAQVIATNSHNSAFASELYQYSSDETNKMIEEYILSSATKSNITMTNRLMHTDAFLQGPELTFNMQEIVQELQENIHELISCKDLVIEQQILLPVLGDKSQFEQAIHLLVALTMKFFKSAILSHMTFKLVDKTVSVVQKIVVQLHLKGAYQIEDDVLKTNIGILQKSLPSNVIDAIESSQEETDIRIQFKLNFYVSTETIAMEHKKGRLHCLFYLEEGSALLYKMKSIFLLTHLDWIEAKSDQDAVNKIKDARLNGDEFNLIISDKKDLKTMELQFLQKISSYVNEQFLGIIHLSHEKKSLSTTKEITLHSLPYSSTLQELSLLLNALRAKQLSRSKAKIINPKIPVFKKNILFYNLEDYAELMYLQIFDTLGIKALLANSVQATKVGPDVGFDAILININQYDEQLISLLDEFKAQFKSIPICLMSPPIGDNDLSVLLAHGLTHYLIKPFSIADLVDLLETNLFS